MDYKQLLRSKPHNKHYLERYIKLIEICSSIDFSDEKLDRHHICPKGNSMFPEYKSLIKNPWNRIDLPKRLHFIAHRILAKAFPESNMKSAYLYMCYKVTHQKSKEFEKIRKELAEASSKYLKQWIKQNGHPKGMLGKKHSEETKKIMSRPGNKNGMYGKSRPDLINMNKNPKFIRLITEKSRNTKFNKKITKMGFESVESAKRMLKEYQTKNIKTNFDDYLHQFNLDYNMSLTEKDMLWCFGYLGNVRMPLKMRPKEITRNAIPNLNFSTIF